MKKNKRLTALLLACLGLLFVMLYALTVYPRIIDMKDRADAATKEKNIAEAKLREAESLDPEEIATDLAVLRSRVPSSLELPNLIVKLDSLATTSELTWVSGTPEDISARARQTATTETDSELLERFDLSVSVRGDISNLIRYIQGMTDPSIGRVVTIKSVDLQFNAEDNPDWVEASLRLEVIGWVDGASINPEGCIENGSDIDCDFKNSER